MKVCKFVLLKDGSPQVNLVYRADTEAECEVMALEYLHKLIELFPDIHWQVEPVEVAAE